MKYANFSKRFKSQKSSFGVMGQMMLEMDLRNLSYSEIETLKQELIDKSKSSVAQKIEMIEFIDKNTIVNVNEDDDRVAGYSGFTGEPIYR